MKIKNNTEPIYFTPKGEVPTDFVYQVNIENRIYFLSAPENYLYRAVIQNLLIYTLQEFLKTIGQE